MPTLIEAFRIYTRENPPCEFCHKAKALLDKERVPYAEFLIEDDANKDYLKSLGLTTVPQIWYNNIHIGGYNNLKSYFTQGQTNANQHFPTPESN